MNSINVEIERARKKFFIQRLQCELNTMDKSNPRYAQLNEIYKTLTKETDELAMTLTIATDKAYAKKWSRLSRFHKISKITEYLTSKFPDEEVRKEKETKILELLEEGKLNSSKSVEYDDVNCQINKIIISSKESI